MLRAAVHNTSQGNPPKIGVIMLRRYCFRKLCVVICYLCLGVWRLAYVYFQGVDVINVQMYILPPVVSDSQLPINHVLPY